jgi:putative cell wall-binding protein
MKKTKKALASLAIASMALTTVPFNVFAAGTVPTRLAGTTAAQTAVQIADQTGWTGTAILASSASYGMVDALTAGPLASYLKAPILLTGAGSTLDADTKAELTKLAVKTVYVTSGTAVISQGVLNELTGMGITVVPLGGIDRAATSVNIAKKMTGVTKVAVANGLQDALSIAAVASAANEPILLTDKNALPASVADYLAANSGITSSDVIGGTGIISDAVKAMLPGATRHAGMSAYDTNSQVIQDFASALEFGNVYVASGVTGIDALAGAPLAAQTKSPIVLTDGTVPAVAAFVKTGWS